MWEVILSKSTLAEKKRVPSRKKRRNRESD